MLILLCYRFCSCHYLVIEVTTKRSSRMFQDDEDVVVAVVVALTSCIPFLDGH
jgi:hypothetical protein